MEILLQKIFVSKIRASDDKFDSVLRATAYCHKKLRIKTLHESNSKKFEKPTRQKYHNFARPLVFPNFSTWVYKAPLAFVLINDSRQKITMLQICVIFVNLINQVYKPFLTLSG